jgi:DnaJ homologue, subfamily C, member 28, conserved domain
MTDRKPPGVSWESWIERQIREGIERGDFDDLPGRGEPLADLDQPHDEMWWVRDKLRREEASFLPPTLAVRKELEDTMERITQAGTETEVRRLVAAINERIRHVNRNATAGPPSTLVPLEVERVVERWRDRER